MHALERLFEALLWRSRLLVLVAVVASLAAAVVVFFVATVDVAGIIGKAAAYADTSLNDTARDALRLRIVASIVKIIDLYLLAVIMLIFALGLYELFISKINIAEGSEFADRMLLIRNFDDLKSRLANVVLLMLVVKLFQEALQMPYGSPSELLYLAGAVVLISAALYLSGKKQHAASDH
jgi:uncharacterized membrane protein YqhA